MYKSLLASAALALASSATLGSEAQPRVEVVYKDLDLSTETGRQALETRLQSAARPICFKMHRGEGLMSRRYIAQCEVEALAAAWKQVDVGTESRIALR